MSVTLKELARELNLDHSTVAYALSGKGTIKENTRLRVQQKATELGYVSNANARRMRAQKTHTLGLAVPDVILIYNELVQHLFHGAIAHNYELQIALTEFNAELEDRALRSLLEARVDGLIIKSRYSRLCDVPPHHALRQVLASGTPAVVYGNPIEGCPLPAFAPATSAVSEMATRHLLDLGHTRFAWLVPVERHAWHSAQTERIAGTRHILGQNGLELPDEAIFTLETPEIAAGNQNYGNYVDQSLPRIAVGNGTQLMKRVLQLSPRPTAILCQNEATAIGAISAAQNAGLKVPDDVAFVATNYTLAAELSPIPLTTVDVPSDLSAQHLLGMLFALIEGQSLLENNVIAPVLRVGGSSVT